jgi:hypothetical protein
MDMSITTTCWATPVRHLILVGLLLALPLAAVTYRRREFTRGRIIAALCAPLVALGIGTIAAAIEFRYIEAGMAAAGVQGKGAFWAAIADLHELRLWGIVPACAIATYALYYLWRFPRTYPRVGLSPQVSVGTILLAYGASTLLSWHPRPTLRPSVISLALSVSATLLSVVLVVVAPRVRRATSAPPIAFAVFLVVVYAASTIGFLVARGNYLSLASGRLGP